MPEVARTEPAITTIRTTEVRTGRSQGRGGSFGGPRQGDPFGLGHRPGRLRLFHVAARDRQLDQPRPLLVVRQVFDPELAVERPQMALHRVDAEEHLVGDLLVGGWGGEVVAGGDRLAERCQNAKLGIGETDVGRGISIHE